jgi:hypothetical protein
MGSERLLFAKLVRHRLKLAFILPIFIIIISQCFSIVEGGRIYTVGVDKRLSDDVEGRYDEWKMAVESAMSLLQSRTSFSFALQLVGGDAEVTPKKDSDGVCDEEQTSIQVVSIGISEAGNQPVFFFPAPRPRPSSQSNVELRDDSACSEDSSPLMIGLADLLENIAAFEEGKLGRTRNMVAASNVSAKKGGFGWKDRRDGGHLRQGEATSSAFLVFRGMMVVGDAIARLEDLGVCVNESSLSSFLVETGVLDRKDWGKTAQPLLLQPPSSMSTSPSSTFLTSLAPSDNAPQSSNPHPSSPNKPYVFEIPTVYPFSSKLVPASDMELRTLARYSAFRLNNHSGFLPPDVQVTQTLYDDQNTPSITVRAGIDIVVPPPEPPPSMPPPPPPGGMLYPERANNTICVVGSLTSGMSFYLQTVFATFGMPQLSPAAATATLSDWTIAPTFTRIISPSNQQARVIVAIATRYNWTRVFMISSTDEFSSTISEAIDLLAIENNISVALHVSVSPKQPSYDTQLQALAKLKPRIIYLVVGIESMVSMIGSLYRVGIRPAAVITSDAIVAVNTSVYTSPTNTPDSFMNGWVVVGEPAGIGEKWDAFLNETYHLSPIEWPGIYTTITNAPRLAALTEAYEVLASAIRDCMSTACDPRNHSEFLSAILSSNTSSLSGVITFDHSGDRPPIFDIRNIQNHTMLRVGRWENTTGFQSFSPIIWPHGNSTPPVAILPLQLVWLSWSSVEGIILASLAFSGMLICIATVPIIVKYRNSAVIRPSTWQMLIVTLFGLFLGFLSSLMWLGEPHEVICHMRFWLVSLGLALTLTPLVAKMWRIMLIFHRPVRAGSGPKSFPLKQLVIIVSVLCGIQVIICTLWSILGSGDVIVIPNRDDPDKAWETCSQSTRTNIFAYVVVGYLGLIALAGALFAFRARRAWKEWNESAWLGRTIYNLVFLSVLIIILAYTIRGFPLVVAILIVVFILVISYTTYAMTFGPKLWLLWRRPELRRPRGAAPTGNAGNPGATTKNVGGPSVPGTLYRGTNAGGPASSSSSAASLATPVDPSKRRQSDSGASSDMSSTSIHFERDKALRKEMYGASGKCEADDFDRRLSGDGDEEEEDSKAEDFSPSCSPSSSIDLTPLSSSLPSSIAYEMKPDSLDASSSMTPDRSGSTIAEESPLHPPD